MVVVSVVAGLGIFWVVVIALAKFEKGDVGVSPAMRARIRLRVAMDNMTRTIGEALLPAFRALAASIMKANEALQPLHDAFAAAEPQSPSDGGASREP